jgi:hypothetical protein
VGCTAAAAVAAAVSQLHGIEPQDRIAPDEEQRAVSETEAERHDSQAITTQLVGVGALRSWPFSAYWIEHGKAAGIAPPAPTAHWDPGAAA